MIINQDDGHIRVHRRLYSHPAFRSWQEATIFAWMIAAAQWRDVVEQTPLGFVTLLRGQFAASERDLAEHCGIPKTTLRRLLARLRQAGMISCGRPTLSVDRDRTATGPQVDRAWTTFTIENYDEYQSVTARSDSVTDRARTTAGPQAVHDRSADTRIYEQDQGANPSDINKGKESKEVPIPLGMGRKRRAARAASEGEVVPDLVSEVHGPTARQRLWREAPSLISALTGKQGRAATAFLGRMVSEADNDCIRVMQVVTEAQRRHPLADPESFLMAGARGGGRSRGTRPPSARETREAEFLAVLTPEQRARAGYAPAFDGSAAFDLDLKPDRENRT